MQKIASQIADRVLQKLAQAGELSGPPETGQRPLTEDLAPAAAGGAIPGMVSGGLAAGFSPGMARAIPNNKLRLLAGLAGGGLAGAGVSSGINTLGNMLLNRIARDEEGGQGQE